MILGVVAYLLVSQTNVFIQQQETQDLEQVSTNFVAEGNRLLNTLEGAERSKISEILSEYADVFVYSYARPTDPEFGLVYILHNKENKVVIENYLGTVVMIEDRSKGDVELQYSDVECILTEINTGGLQVPSGTLTSRWCKQNLDPGVYTTLSNKLERDRGYGLEYSTELNIEAVTENDILVIDIEDIAYYFTVGDQIELSAITRRTEEGEVEIFQSE